MHKECTLWVQWIYTRHGTFILWLLRLQYCLFSYVKTSYYFPMCKPFQEYPLDNLSTKDKNPAHLEFIVGCSTVAQLQMSKELDYRFMSKVIGKLETSYRLPVFSNDKPYLF